MGHLGIDRKNPDFFPVVVMNYILGEGGFASRLMKEIRDNQGLVYSVSSSFGVYRQPGSFSVSLQTKAGNTNKAIAAVLSEVKRFRAEGVSETELVEAKSYLAGSFPLRLETADRLATLPSVIGFYELGLGYFKDYPQQIEKVTQEDILRVANQYLHPDQFTLVVVGNLAEAKIAPTE
jgi:zinc protease